MIFSFISMWLENIFEMVSIRWNWLTFSLISKVRQNFCHYRVQNLFIYNLTFYHVIQAFQILTVCLFVLSVTEKNVLKSIHLFLFLILTTFILEILKLYYQNHSNFEFCNVAGRLSIDLYKAFIFISSSNSWVKIYFFLYEV